MRLLEISAKNYRTLADTSIKFSQDYCTLSGQNNAGKSCVIRLMAHLLEPDRLPWRTSDRSIDYGEDKTQWVKASESIQISWLLRLYAGDDPALISFVETFADQKIDATEVDLRITSEVDQAGATKTGVRVQGIDMDERASREIVAKLRGASCLFLHNSPSQQDRYIYGPGRRPRAYYEVYLSEEEQKMLSDAAIAVQRKTRKLARGHRDALSGMLGKLSDKYDVEFSTYEGYSSREMPLAINLKDKNVEVPIDDWGSGTQNRTYILMSVLQAKRIKELKATEERITPIVVVEEPESFLHPSAQAEFGRLLQELAGELGVQIIVSTHSPFMLNRVAPGANILLRRRLHSRKLLETEVVDTLGDDWMAPFAEHLGIVSPEFDYWAPLFRSSGEKLVLVEGVLDKQYFERLAELLGENLRLPDDVDIVPYGGKDALKNTTLVKFVFSKFDRVFVTFDLDAAQEIRPALERMGMQERRDFLALGLPKSGKSSIEGLLPDSVTSEVFRREPDLVMQLGSQVSSERRDAKKKLKQLLLIEFQQRTTFSDEELEQLSKAMKQIRRAFA